MITARYSEEYGCFRQNSYFDCAETDSGNRYFELLPEKLTLWPGLLGGCNAARMVHAAGRGRSSGKVDVSGQTLRRFTKRQALVQVKRGYDDNYSDDSGQRLYWDNGADGLHRR